MLCMTARALDKSWQTYWESGDRVTKALGRMFAVVITVGKPMRRWHWKARSKLRILGTRKWVAAPRVFFAGIPTTNRAKSTKKLKLKHLHYKWTNFKVKHIHSLIATIKLVDTWEDSAFAWVCLFRLKICLKTVPKVTSCEVSCLVCSWFWLVPLPSGCNSWKLLLLGSSERPIVSLLYRRIKTEMATKVYARRVPWKVTVIRKHMFIIFTYR